MEPAANQQMKHDRLVASFSRASLLGTSAEVTGAETGVRIERLRSAAPSTPSPQSGDYVTDVNRVPSAKFDNATKHGIIRRLLGRNRAANHDSKRRAEAKGIGPYKAAAYLSSNSSHGPPQKGMGNIHQGCPVLTTDQDSHSSMATSQVSLQHQHPTQLGPNSRLIAEHDVQSLVYATPVSMDTRPNGGIKQQSQQDVVTQLRSVIGRLKATVHARDLRIHELEREVDKLRSVLDQQLQKSWAQVTATSAGDAAQFTGLNTEPLPSLPESPEFPADSAQDLNLTSPDPSHNPLPVAALLLRKRLGVSGESMRTTAELKYHEKDAKSRQQIREALRSNGLLMNLDVVQIQEMVSCMHERNVEANCYIIREGDDGEHLYVGAEGQYEVSKCGKRIHVMPPGRCFGELALLYNCKRTASVKALVPSRVWVLERACFQAIMMQTGLKRIEERKAFLRSVPLLKDMPSQQILRIADALEAQYHAPGECIIRQGELADSFFIIQSGVVSVTITSTAPDTSEGEQQEIRQLSKGEYFGEKALLEEGRRTASVYALGPDGVEVLCLYRKDFLELIGDMQELKTKSYVEDGGMLATNKLDQHSIIGSSPDSTHTANQLLVSHTPPTNVTEQAIAHFPKPSGVCFEEVMQPKQSQTNIQLDDLERVCVLGVGGFGRVDLVTLNYDRTQAFALKRMQKHHIVQTRQQAHVFYEKVILYSVDSPFICRLYATYRDSKNIYMLLEACLGGELWTILRDSHHLDDRSTKFCLACSIEALDYLHRHGIIYRDLKPENMLITSRGYIKLCDFGFAKYIGLGNKTWTFCGTPEYVAPEVILNKGHDFAADYWSLGILTFELLTGTPPFQASEPIKVYMKTLKGIDALGLAQNKYICLKALQFIRRLCRFNPSERLGIGKHGIQEIRSHKYFQGFDWAAVAKQTLPTPFKVKLSGPLDYSNFDRFTMDEQEPPDELSGWDANF